MSAPRTTRAPHGLHEPRAPRAFGRAVVRARAGVPVCAAALALMLLAPIALAAQQPVPAAPQLEARIDGVLSPHGGAMAGLGVNIRAGWYARVGLALSAGAVDAAGGAGAYESVQRLDGTARFLFDPFAEARRAFYAGAGIGVRRNGAGDAQGFLLGVVGVEGTTAGRVVPSVELTIGGGARLGVVLRGKRPQGR